MRIRYFGYLANRQRQEKLALCRRLVGEVAMPSIDEACSEPTPAAGDGRLRRSSSARPASKAACASSTQWDRYSPAASHPPIPAPALSSAVSGGQFVNFTMRLAFLSARAGACLRQHAATACCAGQRSSSEQRQRARPLPRVTISTTGKATHDSRRSQSARRLPTPARHALLNRPAARIEFP